MAPEIYHQLFEKARWLSEPLRRATGAVRVGLAVEGFAVPHAHLHVIPLHRPGDLNPDRALSADEADLAEMAAEILRQIEKSDGRPQEGGRPRQ